jgi:hypothetical protein
VLLGLVTSGRCEASESDSQDVAFASGGLGPGSRTMTAVVSLNLSRGSLFYVLRASTVSEFNIFGPSPDESDTDYAVLVGKCSRNPHLFSSAAVGIGFVRSIRRGTLIEQGDWFAGSRYEKVERVTIGLPIDLKTSVNLWGIGVGLNLFANWNPRGSFAGLAFTLQLGKLP